MSKQPKTKTLILYNDFHNTATHLRVEHIGEIEKDDFIYLTQSQVEKAKRDLCHVGCICSSTLGIRSHWHKLNGVEIKLSEYEVYNSSIGKAEGYKLYIEELWE